MFLEKPSSIGTRRTVALVLSVFLCVLRAFAVDSDQLYSDLPLTNAANAQSTVSQTNGVRLSDLFKLKESVSDILSPRSEIVEPNEEQLWSSGFSKRIFCNGFTGCGGRYRGRRRIQEPQAEQLSLSKRPFCNSYGCYNSGRKRFSQSPSQIKNEVPQVQDPNLITFADAWPWARTKKLFCNGYGGCQNMGKRLSLLNPDVTKDDISGHRLSPLFSKSVVSSGGRKRFISGDFESEMESLANDFRRKLTITTVAGERTPRTVLWKKDHAFCINHVMSNLAKTRTNCRLIIKLCADHQI